MVAGVGFLVALRRHGMLPSFGINPVITIPLAIVAMGVTMTSIHAPSPDRLEFRRLAVDGLWLVLTLLEFELILRTGVALTFCVVALGGAVFLNRHVPSERGDVIYGAIALVTCGSLTVGVEFARRWLRSAKS